MNIKTFILAFLLIGSLGINLVLFIGGSLFSVLNSGFETITGIQTVASRNKAEIAGLGEEVIIERNAKREVKGQLTQTTTELANAKITNSKLDIKTKELTADLVAERKIKRQIQNQLTDVTADLATFKSTSAKLKKEMQLATSKAIADRKVVRELQNTLANKTAELSAAKLAIKQLQTKVRDLTAGLVPFKGKKVALKTAVTETADSIFL